MCVCVDLRGFPKTILHFLQGLHGAVKSMTVVPLELGIDTLERRVPVGLRFLDAVAVGLASLVVLGRVLRLGHCELFS